MATDQQVKINRFGAQRSVDLFQISQEDRQSGEELSLKKRAISNPRLQQKLETSFCHHHDQCPPSSAETSVGGWVGDTQQQYHLTYN